MPTVAPLFAVEWTTGHVNSFPRQTSSTSRILCPVPLEEFLPVERTKARSMIRKNQVFFATAGFLIAAFAAQLVYHAVRTSATVDEPDHILAGHRHWQCGDFGINPEHPPLLKLLATAPLNFRTLNEPPWDCGQESVLCWIKREYSRG